MNLQVVQCRREAQLEELCFAINTLKQKNPVLIPRSWLKRKHRLTHARVRSRSPAHSLSEKRINLL